MRTLRASNIPQSLLTSFQITATSRYNIHSNAQHCITPDPQLSTSVNCTSVTLTSGSSAPPKS